MKLLRIFLGALKMIWASNSGWSCKIDDRNGLADAKTIRWARIKLEGLSCSQLNNTSQYCSPFKQRLISFSIKWLLLFLTVVKFLVTIIWQFLCCGLSIVTLSNNKSIYMRISLLKSCSSMRITLLKSCSCTSFEM